MIAMAELDVSPNKEIKGITIRSVGGFVAIVVTVILCYASLKNTLDNTVNTTNDLKQVLKEQSQQNEVQYKILQNQLREQDLRLVRLEAEMKLYNPKIN